MLLLRSARRLRGLRSGACRGVLSDGRHGQENALVLSGSWVLAWRKHRALEWAVGKSQRGEELGVVGTLRAGSRRALGLSGNWVLRVSCRRTRAWERRWRAGACGRFEISRRAGSGGEDLVRCFSAQLGALAQRRTKQQRWSRRRLIIHSGADGQHSPLLRALRRFALREVAAPMHP